MLSPPLNDLVLPSAASPELLADTGLLDAGGRGVRIGLCSRGLLSVPGLKTFLGLPEAELSVVNLLSRRGYDLYVGWGWKPSGQRAVRRAEADGKPLLLLEDGFIRSVFPPSAAAAPPLSLAVDDIGIYYDADQPSRLERLIWASAMSSTSEAKGREIVELLKQRRLSKYNNFEPIDPAQVRSRVPRPVLVVDQLRGDHSIADARAFQRMLQAAADENPGAEIWIKAHPGSGKGHLPGALPGSRVRPLSKPHNPWDFFPLVSKVYVVSSQLGFEALMAGLQVRCFGMPFYAGWGLTRDEGTCQRREGHAPTVHQMADAVYRQYCRYRDPYHDRRIEFAEAAAIMTQLKSVAERTQDVGRFVSIYPWYRRRFREIFQANRPHQKFTSFPRSWPSGERSITAVWASRLKPEWEKKAEAAGAPLSRIEDGFLRSAGLGANFHQPMSLVLDHSGIHYDASKPSDLERQLAAAEFDDELIARSRKLIDQIRRANVCKYNADSAGLSVSLPTDRAVIFVPGQVEDDASVRCSGSSIQTNLGLLEAVRAERPEAFILFKPHPDVASGHRTGHVDWQDLCRAADHVVYDVPISKLIDACDEVHTISSLTGFFALLREKPVVCHGLPFYAGWGLTGDKLECPRRQRRLSVEELVAGALILHPFYFDPVSGLPCTPEIVVQRIREAKVDPRGTGLVYLRSVLGHLRRLRRSAADASGIKAALSWARSL